MCWLIICKSSCDLSAGRGIVWTVKRNALYYGGLGGVRLVRMVIIRIPHVCFRYCDGEECDIVDRLKVCGWRGTYFEMISLMFMIVYMTMMMMNLSQCFKDEGVLMASLKLAIKIRRKLRL